jgi:hypothetical protein
MTFELHDRLAGAGSDCDSAGHDVLMGESPRACAHEHRGGRSCHVDRIHFTSDGGPRGATFGDHSGDDSRVLAAGRQ